jgi:membrane associated rhomboid family serine protease
MISPTFIILILTIVASIYAWNNKSIYSKWMMNPYKIHKHDQYYRFITSGFIHGDWIHLAFNMFALFSFGLYLEGYLEAQVGGIYHLYYYGIYLLALIVSDLPTYFKNKDNENYNSLGASGAVAAIIFACIIIRPVGTIYVYVIPVKSFIFGFLYLGYSYYSSKKSLGGVNHDAHFYGAVFGVASILIIDPSASTRFFEQISNWLGSIF